MKRKTMQSNAGMTLREVCEKYLDNCVQRNLGEFTVLHYRENWLAMENCYSVPENKFVK